MILVKCKIFSTGVQVDIQQKTAYNTGRRQNQDRTGAFSER